jgi:hypothetical protein
MQPNGAEPSRAEPRTAHVFARKFELEPRQPLEQRLAGLRAGIGIHQVGRAPVLPLGPVALVERLEHQADESRLGAERHREGQEIPGRAEVVRAAAQVKQHAHAAPADVGQGADPVEEVQQHSVPVQDVMVAERIEVPFALEASRQATQAVTALHHGDVGDAGARQRVGGRGAGQSTTEHDDRGVRHG